MINSFLVGKLLQRLDLGAKKRIDSVSFGVNSVSKSDRFNQIGLSQCADGMVSEELLRLASLKYLHCKLTHLLLCTRPHLDQKCPAWQYLACVQINNKVFRLHEHVTVKKLF